MPKLFIFFCYLYFSRFLGVWVKKKNHFIDFRKNNSFYLRTNLKHHPESCWKHYCLFSEFHLYLFYLFFLSIHLPLLFPLKEIIFACVKTARVLFFRPHFLSISSTYSFSIYPANQSFFESKFPPFPLTCSNENLLDSILLIKIIFKISIN